MTDKQPEALRLADELEEPIDGFPEATELESKAAAELRRLHAEIETLTLYKSLADEYGLYIFKDLKDLTTEIESLRAKLKTYEGLGDAADDMQLLRMGYAAARLEIESLRDEVKEYRHAAGVQKTLIETLLAEKPAGAQQPGAAYAALPGLFREALAWGMTYGPEIPAHQWDEMRESMVKHYTERASHGQAPAQAAPTTQPTDRHALQAEGKHPAPCARFCEANAFRADRRSDTALIRQLLEALQANSAALWETKGDPETPVTDAVNAARARLEEKP
jgi:hypothetical protein